MRKSQILITILILVLIEPLILNVKADTVLLPKSIIVDINGNGNFTSISDAIDSADDGDLIYIHNGHYYESVLVNKEVSLIGNGTENTFIHGTISSQYVLRTDKGNNRIEGLTLISNNNVSQTCFIGSSYDEINIRDCKFIGGYYGIISSLRYDDYLRIEIEDCIIPIRINDNVDRVDLSYVNISSKVVDKPYLIINSDSTKFRNCNLYNCSFPINSVDVDIDSTNNVNGKPYRSYKYQHSIDVPSNTGQLIMERCNDAIISNLNISNQESAIYIYDSDNYEIKNCNFYNIYDTPVATKFSMDGLIS
jgi:hypothetical protein